MRAETLQLNVLAVARPSVGWAFFSMNDLGPTIVGPSVRDGPLMKRRRRGKLAT